LKLLHTGTVSDGKMRFDNRKMLDDHIKELEGKRFGLVLSEQENTRSVRQNAFLWGVCYPMVVRGWKDKGEVGVNNDVAHKFLTEMFLEPKICHIKSSNKVVIEYSTKTLSKKLFSEYWGMIQMWAAEKLQIYIPDPNEELLNDSLNI
jgi:hypothetical protein